MDFRSRSTYSKPAAVQRPHGCPHCPLRFSQKGTLNRHMVTHLQILPFECQYCEKRYAQAGSLRLHLFSHRQGDGFSCPVCGRRFARKHTLRLHVQGVHRQERPHKCVTCGKGYARRDDLQLHQRSCGNAPRQDSVSGPYARDISVKAMFAQMSSEDSQHARVANDYRHHRLDTNNNCKMSPSATPLSSFQEKLRLQHSILACDSAGDGMEVNDEQFTAAVEQLLLLLVGKDVLMRLGWPNAATEDLLQRVIRSCGSVVPPESKNGTLRENCRQFFSSFLEGDDLQDLFGAHGTVEDVVTKILRLKDVC